MEDENCRSLSGYTDSTEQSAPVNFDMSNRVSKTEYIKFISRKRQPTFSLKIAGKTATRN